MKRTLTNFSIIALCFSELYTAIVAVLLKRIRKSINMILRPAIYIGIFVTLTSFIVGFSSINNTRITPEVSTTVIKSLEDKPVLAINNYPSKDLVVYNFNDSGKLLLHEDNVSVSRGGFIDRTKKFDITNTTTTTTTDENQVETPEPAPSILESYSAWTGGIGNDVIQTEFGSLVKCGLPSDYGDTKDYSTFKPYMDYKAITARGTAAYRVSHSNSAYNDDKGFRRYNTSGSSEFTVNNYVNDNGVLCGDDDYLIALGSYYTKGYKEGQRFLIITDNGMFTAKIGDHKANQHTDDKNMYSFHGKYAGLIEFIVNTEGLEKSVRDTGTISSSSIEDINGKILAIYRIES